MNISIVRDEEFTPEWNGNRDDSEPIVVDIQALTSEQRMAAMTVGTNPDGTLDIRIDHAKFFRYGAKSIRNLNVDGKALTSALDVIRSKGQGLDGFIREVGSEIFIRNQETDKKN